MRLDDWVLEQRGPKTPRLDPRRAYASLWEEEPDADGALVSTVTVFVTNRECPFRCLMCDLWINTLDSTVPHGAVPEQIRHALERLPAARHIKLYNAGSFFDPQAIPPEDDSEIARVLTDFQRVIVEAHPAFLTGAYADRCRRFHALVRGRLEVAIGLETAHPGVLARLNKRMTLDGFRRAAEFLADHDIVLRVFILLNPPFLRGDEAILWACRSLDVAVECGAAVCSVIPTRPGNGALEAMGSNYERPRLAALEAAVEYGLSLGRCRVFADLWDLERFYDCMCSPRRAARLRTMNLEQRAPGRVMCSLCGGGESTIA